MDWFSWFSKADLEPAIAYEYGLLFVKHELEEEDMVFFTHEFLHCMGIQVAKHRLEILKMAKREYGKAPYAQRLLASLKKGNRKFKRFLNRWIHRCHQTHDIHHSSGMVRSSKFHDSPKMGCFCPFMQNKKLLKKRRSGGGEQYRSPMRFEVASSLPSTPVASDKNGNVLWASMFENLKPT